MASILKKKQVAETKTVSVRIPSALADELDAVKAKAEAAGFEFDLPAVVIEALGKALKSARAELDAANKMQTAMPASAG